MIIPPPKPCKLVYTNLDKDGYARMGHNHISSARFFLEQKLGRPIQEGFEACHTCDSRNCIEPEHLYEGTHSQNIQDAFDRGRKQSGWAIHNLAKTECPQGHEYTDENTYIDKRGKRYCRECKRIEQQKRRGQFAQAR